MNHAGERQLEYARTVASPGGEGGRPSIGAFVLPILTSLILLIPTLLYWAHGRSVSDEFQQSRVSQYRLRLAKRIQTEVDSQLRPLRRLANEISSGDVASAIAFENSARSICREEPPLKFIAWVGRNGKCYSVFPSESAETISGELFPSDKGGPDELFSRLAGYPNGLLRSFPTKEATRAADRLIVLPITTPATTTDGKPGESQIDGAIVSCETTQAMLGTMIPPDASAPFIVEVKDERRQMLFASEGATSGVADSLLRSADVDQIPVLDQSWSMSIASAPPGLGQRPTSDTDAFLFSGLIVALLGGATVAQAARHRRRERQKSAEHMAALEETLEQQQSLNAQITRDADAKATLLRELNHRVKNNLAGIVGLLSAGVPELSEQAQRWLDRAIARIETLARAHELFVGTSVKGSTEVKLDDLVGKTLEPIFAIKPASVRIEMDLSSVDDLLSTDQAVTLAMVVHELATNALQHGLGDHGLMWVCASRIKLGWVMIQVIDDGTRVDDRGVAFGPKSNTAVAIRDAQGARTGIGLQLVRGLVGRELHGTFQIRENARGGTTATVQFPIGTRRSAEIA